MRGFGRSCRGHGHVFVKLVRQTEHQLLDLGQPIATLAQQVQERLHQTTALSEPQRARLSDDLTTALSHHEDIRQQSKRLTQGKKLGHCKIVNAYDLTLAPIIKGKSNCPAQSFVAAGRAVPASPSPELATGWRPQREAGSNR